MEGLDQTTLQTLSLLESRLLRIEHLIHGQATPSTATNENESVAQRMGNLEKRFGLLTSHVRVYGDLMDIYKANPDFFHAAAPSEPPSDLTQDALRAIVMSSAPSYSSTLSALTAIKDSPVPDPSESAALIALNDKMKSIEALQVAQEADMAQLRARSEVALRKWFEGDRLRKSELLADVEGRFEQVEREVRRKERDIERAAEV